MRTLKTNQTFLPFAICWLTLATAPAPAQFSPNVAVYANGLDNPRGLKFGPDGKLYVAEAGIGGTTSTLAICPALQIPPPAGPVLNGRTARISRIDGPFQRTTVINGFPSAQSAFPDWQGVADVAFIGTRMFALLQGGGCPYGEAVIPKSVVEINVTNQTFRIVANPSAFYLANPPAVPPYDFEAEGVWYSMIAVRDRIYIIEANAGGLYEVSTNGAVRRLVDFSASGHLVPTALAWHGNFYVGNLGVFPTVNGASRVWKVTPSGQTAVAVDGLTGILGLAFDNRGRLYALETDAAPFPDVGNGRVVRIHPSGRADIVATGLTFPTAMTYGPDGHLYVSNRGYDIPPAGTGEVLKISIPD
ncbi:MAG: ScyD/ScyE family protein [Bryobacteraceae bacterium]